jgi:hypothetical protein
MCPSSSGLLAPHVELIAGAGLRSKPADGVQRATKFVGGACQRRLIVPIARRARQSSSRPAFPRDILNERPRGTWDERVGVEGAGFRSAPSHARLSRKGLTAAAGDRVDVSVGAAAPARRITAISVRLEMETGTPHALMREPGDAPAT